MTAITLGLAPGTPTSPAALAVVEYQWVARPDPYRPQGDRWVIQDTVRWPLGAPLDRVVSDACQWATGTGGRLVYDRTEGGEAFAELFSLARLDGRLKERAFGVVLTAGQIPSDVGFPRVTLVHKFEAKLASGRVVVGRECTNAGELRKQLADFTSARRRPADPDAQPEDLLLASMLGVQSKRFRPGEPRYVARNGKTYYSRAVSPDTY